MNKLLYDYIDKDITDYVIIDYLTPSYEESRFLKNVLVNELKNIQSLHSRFFDPYYYYIFNKYKRKTCWINENKIRIPKS